MRDSLGGEEGKVHLSTLSVRPSVAIKEKVNRYDSRPADKNRQLGPPLAQVAGWLICRRPKETPQGLLHCNRVRIIRR